MMIGGVSDERKISKSDDVHNEAGEGGLVVQLLLYACVLLVVVHVLPTVLTPVGVDVVVGVVRRALHTGMLGWVVEYRRVYAILNFGVLFFH